MAHDASRPLVEEHHLSYGGSAGEGAANADGTDEPSHEITVALCRWCHAKVHTGFARVDDDASPVPEAIAERESRRGREMEETGFSTASERLGNPGSESDD